MKTYFFYAILLVTLCSKAVSQPLFKVDLNLGTDWDDYDAVVNQSIPFSFVLPGFDTYSWDFGNGQTSTLQNPTINYTELDIYTLSLTVTKADSFRIIDKLTLLKTSTLWSDCITDGSPDYYLNLFNTAKILQLKIPDKANDNCPVDFYVNGYLTADSVIVKALERDDALFCPQDDNLGQILIPANTISGVFEDNNGDSLKISLATKMVTTATFKVEIKVGKPKLTATVIVTDASCYSCTDGSASVNVSGGTEPYSYKWSNGDTTQTINYLAVGNYGVTITDADSSMLFKIAKVSYTTSINEATSEDASAQTLEVFPTISTGQFTVTIPEKFINSQQNTFLQVYNLQGVKVFSSPVSHSIEPINLYHLPNSVYIVQVYSQGKTYDTAKITVAK